MYRAMDIVEGAGITYRQLDYWTRQGWLTPINKVNRGQDRLYEFADLRLATLVKRLLNSGIEVTKAFGYAKKILEEPEYSYLYDVVKVNIVELASDIWLVVKA